MICEKGRAGGLSPALLEVFIYRVLAVFIGNSRWYLICTSSSNARTLLGSYTNSQIDGCRDILPAGVTACPHIAMGRVFGDPLDFSDLLSLLIKDLFAAELDSFKAGLHAQSLNIMVGMRDHVAKIGTRRSKMTRFGVLGSGEPALSGSGNAVCVTGTANMAALRDQRQLDCNIPGSERRCALPLGPYLPLDRAHAPKTRRMWGCALWLRAAF